LDFKDLSLKKEGHVAILTLNRPDKLNAIGYDMALSLPAAIEAIEKDDEVRSIILTGAGRAFCAGGDVGDQKQKIQGDFPLHGRQERLRLTGDVILGFEKSSKPIIAAINGVTAGVGLTLTLICDIRIAADTARFSAIWVKRGLIPDGGATYLLPKIIGMDKALELSYTTEFIDAAEAERIKLVTKVVPAGELMTQAKELAHKIAEMPPITIGLTKNIMWEEIRSNMRKVLIAESYAQNLCRTTEDHQESVKAFLEKREPQYKGK